MALVSFARAFRRHVDCPDESVTADTVGAALHEYFARHPNVRGYVVDERGRLRRHVTVFVGDVHVAHSDALDHPVDSLDADDTIYIFQALSGG